MRNMSIPFVGYGIHKGMAGLREFLPVGWGADSAESPYK
jgi:hypothetical protein